MSILDLNLQNVQPLTTVPEAEYELMITSVSEITHSEKADRDYFTVSFEIIGRTDTKDITHTFMLAKPEDDEKEKRRRLGSIRLFYEAFGLPLSGPLDLNGIIGRVGLCHLTVRSSDFGDQNRIQRFVVRPGP